MKLGVQPDRVLQSMLNDRMVAKGLILQYATAFFQDYLSTESIDDLVALLRKARLDTHLLDLFPPQRRTLKDLDEHFKVRCFRIVVWPTYHHSSESPHHRHHRGHTGPVEVQAPQERQGLLNLYL